MANRNNKGEVDEKTGKVKQFDKNQIKLLAPNQ